MFNVVYGDILEQDVDAIVVPQLPLEGVLSELTSRIYKAAGFQNMMVAYNMAMNKAKAENERLIFADSYNIALSRCEHPLVVITPGLGLKAKHAIHVVVDTKTWWDGQPGSEREQKEYVLFYCYYRALESALDKLNAKSIVFPLLGTSLLGVPIEFSRTVAKSAINSFCKKRGVRGHTPRGWDKDENYKRMEICLVIPFTEKNSKPTASSVDAYNDTGVFLEHERTLADKTKRSGLDRDAFFRKTSYEYLNRIDNDSKMAELLGFGSDVIHRFKSKQSGSGKGSVPKKWRVIALAIGLGLDDYERFEFIRCAGYEYPAEDLDFQVEKILRSGPMGFVMLNEKLCKINPEYDLTKPAKKEDGQKNR